MRWMRFSTQGRTAFGSVEGETIAEVNGCPFKGYETTSITHALAHVKIELPFVPQTFYAAGLNYYGALHPDEGMRGLLPVTGKDIVAGFVFKLPFFHGFDRVLMELFEPTRHRSISMGAGAFRVTDEPNEMGSNAIALSRFLHRHGTNLVPHRRLQRR